MYVPALLVSPILPCDIWLLSFICTSSTTINLSVHVRLNPIFATGLTLTLFISLVCCLKRQNNFLKCHIPTEYNIGSSGDAHNYLFYFFWTGWSDPTRLCGFRHALVDVSGRDGADGYALASFCSFLSGRLSGCGDPHFLCSFTDCPSLDIEKV